MNFAALLDYGPRLSLTEKETLKRDATKRCNKCGEVKSIDSFSHNHGTCKVCRVAENRAARKRNKNES